MQGRLLAQPLLPGFSMLLMISRCALMAFAVREWVGSFASAKAHLGVELAMFRAGSWRRTPRSRQAGR
jgi:hypothetical protein